MTEIVDVSVFLAGQDDIPLCFATGECTASLSLETWNVDTVIDCLVECQKDADCEFFNFYDTGAQKKTCNGLANCAFYSENSCSNCMVGRRDCSGKQKTISKIVLSHLHTCFLPREMHSPWKMCGSFP